MIGKKKEKKLWLSDDETKKVGTIKARLNEEKDYEALRARWDKEDELLSSRTNAFLTVNAILFAATQIQPGSNSFSIGFALIGIILTVFWMITSKRSADLIQLLFTLCSDISPDYAKLMYEFRKPKRRFAPSNIMAIILPRTILACWILYTIWLAITLNLGKNP